jgi:RNA polymerase sigma-70 factor (ECF subfamily)
MFRTASTYDYCGGSEYRFDAVAHMTTTWTESDLVDGCREGRRDALDALVQMYYDRIFRLAWALAGAEAAADLAQETFLSAVKAAPRFRGDAHLSTWLISILRNQYSLLVRGFKRWKASPLPEQGLGIAAPEPPEVDQELREILDRVKELPEDLRTTLVLYHVEGMRYADIARTMECPIGTVRSRLFEARERLRRLVARPEEL